MAVLPAVVAHQVHKNSGAEVFPKHAALLFAKTHEPLCAGAWPYGNKQNTALIKLIRQGARHFRPARCNDDSVKRGGLRHAQRAVSPLHMYAAQAHVLQEDSCVLIEFA